VDKLTLKSYADEVLNNEFCSSTADDALSDDWELMPMKH
jgi:hypothetical protein